MEFDVGFRDFILNKENYLFFDNEINYYTGLKRDESDILKTVVQRMADEYKDLMKIIEESKCSYDLAFTTKKTLVSQMNGKFVEQLRSAGKPSQKDMDRLKDEVLDLLKSERGIKKKQKQLNPLRRLERLWILAAKVLKNTEETSVLNLKDNSYRKILKCSMAFAYIYKQYIEDYLEEHGERLNPAFREGLEVQNRFLPFIHQTVLYTFLGTAKLSVVLRDKINSDATVQDISDFEKFCSVFIYADIKGKEYPKYIKKFIKSIKVNYIADAALFKVLGYYYFRSKSKASDKNYENIIGDLIVYSKGLKKIEKGKVVTPYRKRKQKGKASKDMLLVD